MSQYDQQIFCDVTPYLSDHLWVADNLQPFCGRGHHRRQRAPGFSIPSGENKAKCQIRRGSSIAKRIMLKPGTLPRLKRTSASHESDINTRYDVRTC